MTQPTDQQLQDDIEAVDLKVRALAQSKLSTADFKDGMAKLEKSLTAKAKGKEDDKKEKEDDKTIVDVLADTLGMKDQVDAIMENLSTLTGKDIPAIVKNWSASHQTTLSVVTKVAAVIAAVGAAGAAIGLLVKLVTSSFNAIVAYFTKDEAAPQGKKYVRDEETGKRKLVPIDPEPIEQVQTLLAKIDKTLDEVNKSVKPIEQIGPKIDKLGPKFATLSKGIRTTITKTNELKTDVGTLNSGISGLTGHMTTFNSRMSAMTEQIKHMNLELTGSAP